MDTNNIAELREHGARWLRANHTLNPTDSEDVLQDALIELVKKDERVTLVNPGGMLGAIIDRRVKDAMRRNRRRAEHEVPAGGFAELATAENEREKYGSLSRPSIVNEPFFAANFDVALRELPTEQRDAFILYELRGLTEFEAAQVLDIPASTVVSRADLARTALRKEL